MCGFVGVYGNINQEFQDKKIFLSLKHRGPDSSGKFVSENCVMFHSRLTIIGDAFNGLQPMTDNEKFNTLVFNGEIYNWQNLRNTFFPDEIKKIKSDTHLILKLYGKFGISFVEKLQGIFSFVIFSKKDNKIFMVRDRFGVKPLFYKKNSKNIFFSTEIKSLIALGIEKKLNYSILKSYLEESKLCHNNETFFQNIYSLEPATIYEVSKIGNKKKRYWKLINNNKIDYNENQIDELISESILSNTVSDTEIGVALSSGIDSSIIANELLKKNKNLKSFSFGFKETQYNEIDNINDLFSKDDCLIKYYKIFQHKNLLSELKKAIYFFETPLGGVGTLSSFSLFKIARQQKIKVLLSGEGADELFGGYKYYFLNWLKQLYQKNELTKLNQIIQEYNFYQDDKLSKKSLNLFFKDERNMFAPDGSSIASKQNYLSKKFENISCSKHFSFKKEKDILTNEIYNDIFWRKLPKLLHFQDRASMANSVESRVPFLDHKLWEKIFTTNPKYLFKNGYTKQILRKNYENRFHTFNNKSKKYVATPQREWLKKNLMKSIIDIIANGKLNKEKLINVEKWIRDYKFYSQSHNLGNSFFIWKMLNAEFLLEEFF